MFNLGFLPTIETEGSKEFGTLFAIMKADN
jgi:hypothetical protein